MSSTSTITTTTLPPTTTRTLTLPHLITADNVTSLFPDVSPSLLGADLPPNHTSSTSTHDNSDLSGYDAEQIRLMDEQCIVLSLDDQILGSATKKYCHLMSNISQGLLHRAFSVFLFHPKSHKLLLQQRASEKITFPDMWTNTCCSHPLAHPSETGTNEDLSSSIEGAKRAATRKLNHELGIPTSQVPASNFSFLTRIHYLAPSGSDGKWGEHEIDYILFIEAEVDLDVNVNEVQDTRWVSKEELKQMFKDVEERAERMARGEVKEGENVGIKYTPWFKLICEGMLFQWWEALEQGRLSEFTGDEEIRRML